MSGTFLWTCPYCDRDTTITNSNFDVKFEVYNNNNKEGSLGFQTTMIACPNPKCKEYTFSAKLYKTSRSRDGFLEAQGEAIAEWRLRPNSSARPMPEFVPSVITDDYNEACLIRDLSPKASATLSRRCLQGMIRDFYGISKRTLAEEIIEIKTKVDTTTWAAIDAVRSIGNIGAHMEKDINIIIDVEPMEAQVLIGLIEMLVKDWYVAREEREKRMRAVVALAEAKKPASAKHP